MGSGRDVADAVRSRDYLRRSLSVSHAESRHKEWLHFSINAEGLSFVVNFSFVDDDNPRAAHGAELARVTCLVHAGGWTGDVDLWESGCVHAVGGELDLALGDNRLQFIDGRYRLRVRMRRCGVEADLELVPEVFPLETNNVALGEGALLNWVVLPRLRAAGTIRIGERVHTLSQALAYHDHNWGRFAWGKTFGWEWGYVLPRATTNPFSLAFVRLSDRGRRCAWLQGIFVWRFDRQARLFRDAQVSLSYAGLLRPRAPFKVPRVASLVHPGTACDVPQTLRVTARDGADWLRIELACRDVAQIVIPNELDLGLTVIQEVVCDAHVRGAVEGESLDLEGHSICELLGD